MIRGTDLQKGCNIWGKMPILIPKKILFILQSDFSQQLNTEVGQQDCVFLKDRIHKAFIVLWVDIQQLELLCH